MKPLVILLSALLFPLLTTSAQAGDALEALQGEWVVETFDGDPPEGVEIRITFVDDDTMQTEFIVDGATVVDMEERYEADEDGAITTYSREFPEGAVGTWEVLEDGKLRLEFKGIGIDGVLMVVGKA